MADEALQIVFEKIGTKPEKILRKTYAVLARAGVRLDAMSSRGKATSLLAATRELQKSARRGFSLEGQGLEIQFASLARCSLDFLLVKSSRDADWSVWVAEFVEEPAFTMAWVVDVDYDYWQNATDPLEYQAVGRDYATLPMKPTGLPPPLDEFEIDTSQNPGRRVLREGYIEAVGATMWFGANFWKKTGVRQTDVTKADWLVTRDEGFGVLKIQAATENFRVATGDMGARQVSLRALLFP